MSISEDERKEFHDRNKTGERFMISARGTERQFPRHSLGRGGWPKVPLTLRKLEHRKVF